MLRKLLRFFFSIKNEKYHRVVTIFGIKIKYFHPLTEGVYFCPVCNRYGRFMDMGEKEIWAKPLNDGELAGLWIWSASPGSRSNVLIAVRWNGTGFCFLFIRNIF